MPDAVPGLRRTLRRHFGAPCPDVQLCVTELVADVIRHVGEGTPVRVRVSRTAGARVRVGVTDPDARALPTLLHATAADENGRGLALLDAVALRWGVEQRATGKTVWCELPEAPTSKPSPGPICPPAPAPSLSRTHLGRDGSPSAPPRPIPR
ncbi:ATP-binding protein [Streptomyces sp. NPDC006739]|uniref:ATP-binding protein n=1 Tax=Streptomyces sp. NPDC006739 TaxID=3364763 RepID=UPI003698738F